MSMVPFIVVVLVVATVALMRTGRDASSGAAAVPEPALPAPPAGIDIATVVGLARRESLLLLRHPAVLVGYALSTIAVVFLCGVGDGVRHRAATSVGISAFPLAGLTLVAANLCALRSRRFSAQGMIDTTPVSPTTRLAAHMVSVLGPSTVFALIVAGWVAFVTAADAPGVFPSIAEMAQGPVLVVCAGVCGVLLAAWVPTPLVAVPAVLLLGLVEGGVASLGPEHRTVRLLAWWVPQPEDVPVEVWHRAPGLHLAYLVALALLVAAVALARSLPRRVAAGLTAAACVLALVAGVVVTRPVSTADARRMAAWVNEAAERQRCTEVDGVRLCAYPEYDFRADWAPVVARVMAAAPVKPRQPIAVVQRLPRRATEHISPAVVRRFSDDAPRSPAERWRADGAVHPELRWDLDGYTDKLLALDVAQVLVGLPADQDRDGRTCTAADQARGVVALWIAGHGSDDARRGVAELAGGEDFDVDLDLGGEKLGYTTSLFPAIGVESWVASYDPAVRWSVRDVRFAVKLLASDADDVTRVLRDHWDDVLDPRTTTDELAGWLAVDPGPTLDEIARGIGTSEAEAERLLSVPAQDPGPYAHVAPSRGPCP